MKRILLSLLPVLALGVFAISAEPNLGIFTDEGSIGKTPDGCKVQYDAAKGEYRITGGGANVWDTSDAFYFVWKKALGDLTLMADVEWVGTSAAYFHGAPELVIEVLSPSNTESEIRDKRNLCLANGSMEFWVVDPQKREVDVHTRVGRFTTYGPGQQIPLFFLAGASIPVDAIFA